MEEIKIKAVLGDELTKLPSSTKYMAVKIFNKKDTNKIIQEFNSKLPIDAISYVRRVFKDEILLCPVDEITSNEELDERTRLKNFLVAKKIPESMIDDIMKNDSRTVNIFNSVPLLRWQLEEMNKDWPCKFHKTDYLEALYNNSLFNESELKSHHQRIEICKYLSIELQNDNVAIAVNPYNNRIVAFGYSKTTKHPVVHCAIDLIDQVAITQNGGVWSTEHDEKYTQVSKNVTEKFSVKFGEGSYEKSLMSSDNLHKFGPYLCTGYLIYLLNEPCMMCSMALVHARSKRIFYHRASANGTLGSVTKLHTNKNLNHRYEVFQASFKIKDDKTIDT